MNTENQIVKYTANEGKIAGWKKMYTGLKIENYSDITMKKL